MKAEEQMQLIDQHQTFSPQLQYYLKDVWSMIHNGLDYKIVAIFGSQSSGKSTLLNGLFKTEFAVMREEVRSQTTHGIWLSKALGAPYLILDVEGTDGRERGENQDFERKSALFSMAIAQVVMINMWEHSVGLYNGANMGLLRTVFEVNLQLFQKMGSPKTLLLFVIRDFLGATPLSNLEKIILTDLNNTWSHLSKPQNLENSTLFDFFDVDFVTLPHKFLLPEKFSEDINSISERFYNPEDPDYVFNRDLSKLMPIDGFYTYSSNIWDTIRTNKDLDLPTQQELLAQFRCDEISSEIYRRFLKEAKEKAAPSESGNIIDGFAVYFENLRKESLDEFILEASRYNANIVKKKSNELFEKMNTALKVYFIAQIKNLYKKSLHLFISSLEASIKANASKFASNATMAKEKASEMFLNGAENWHYNEFYDELLENIHEKTLIFKKEEMKKLFNTLLENFITKISHSITAVLDKSSGSHVWKDLMDHYQSNVTELIESLRRTLEGFGLSNEEYDDVLQDIYAQLWDSFIKKLKAEFTGNTMLLRLRARFERNFKYNPQGLPNLWKPSDDMDTPFKKAVEEGQDLLKALSRFQNVPKKEFIPCDFKFDSDRTIEFLPESQLILLQESFMKECEVIYIDAKRSTLVTTTTIPTWLIVLLILLGWNEFIAVLSSPVYLILAVLLGSLAYIIYVLKGFPLIERGFWEVFNAVKGRVVQYLHQYHHQMTDQAPMINNYIPLQTRQTRHAYKEPEHVETAKSSKQNDLKNKSNEGKEKNNNNDWEL